MSFYPHAHSSLPCLFCFLLILFWFWSILPVLGCLWVPISTCLSLLYNVVRSSTQQSLPLKGNFDITVTKCTQEKGIWTQWCPFAALCQHIFTGHQPVLGMRLPKEVWSCTADFFLFGDDLMTNILKIKQSKIAKQTKSSLLKEQGQGLTWGRLWSPLCEVFPDLPNQSSLLPLLVDLVQETISDDHVTLWLLLCLAPQTVSNTGPETIVYFFLKITVHICKGSSPEEVPFRCHTLAWIPCAKHSEPSEHPVVVGWKHKRMETTLPGKELPYGSGNLTSKKLLNCIKMCS